MQKSSREPAAAHACTLLRMLLGKTDEKILRIVQFRNEIDALAPIGLLRIQTLQIAQRRKDIEHEADRLKQGSFAIVHTPPHPPAHHARPLPPPPQPVALTL